MSKTIALFKMVTINIFYAFLTLLVHLALLVYHHFNDFQMLLCKALCCDMYITRVYVIEMTWT